MNRGLGAGAFVAVVVAGILALAGCDGIGDDSTNENGTLTGTWVGQVTTGSGTYAINLRLVSTGAAVSGTWTVTGNGVDETGSVTGTTDDDAATLRLYSNGVEVAVIALDLDDDTATGNSDASVAYLAGTVSLTLP